MVGPLFRHPVRSQKDRARRQRKPQKPAKASVHAVIMERSSVGTPADCHEKQRVLVFDMWVAETGRTHLTAVSNLAPKGSGDAV